MGLAGLRPRRPDRRRDHASLLLPRRHGHRCPDGERITGAHEQSCPDLDRHAHGGADAHATPTAVTTASLPQRRQPRPRYRPRPQPPPHAKADRHAAADTGPTARRCPPRQPTRSFPVRADRVTSAAAPPPAPPVIPPRWSSGPGTRIHRALGYGAALTVTDIAGFVTERDSLDPRLPPSGPCGARRRTPARRPRTRLRLQVGSF